MTETPNPSDQAERIRRLQERRAASGRSRQTVSTSAGTSEATAPKRSRRRHPAAATRILLAGLSVSSFFSVAGAIALTHRSTTAPTATAPTVSGPGPATNASGTASALGAAAQPGVASNVTAHTTTAAS
jgi:hypothetical protein